jgi:hypothetical protein
LNTTPPFITKSTCSSTVISARGIAFHGYDVSQLAGLDGANVLPTTAAIAGTTDSTLLQTER